MNGFTAIETISLTLFRTFKLEPRRSQRMLRYLPLGALIVNKGAPPKPGPPRIDCWVAPTSRRRIAPLPNLQGTTYWSPKTASAPQSESCQEWNQGATSARRETTSERVMPSVLSSATYLAPASATCPFPADYLTYPEAVYA
jgi:hypothetical protein